MVRDIDVEKALLAGQVGKQQGHRHLDFAEDERRHRVCCERRRQTWRLLLVGLVVFCIGFSVIGVERRSLALTGESAAWFSPSRSSAQSDDKPTYLYSPAAPNAGPSHGSPEYTILDKLHHMMAGMTAEAGHHKHPLPPAPVPFWQKGAQKQSHKGMKLYKPTAALRKLAAKLHQVLPKPTWSHFFPGTPVPTHDDSVLLLLSAARSKMYHFPAEAKERIAQLMPGTQAAFAQMLRTIMPAGAEEADARMYASAHDDWLLAHRVSSPLTVFSKSYCPYSKKAKALLTSMGAHFEVHEVDLREDAVGLQGALREISGHTTFPTIFIGDELLGGSDDLQRLFASNELKTKLEAGHVQFG